MNSKTEEQVDDNRLNELFKNEGLEPTVSNDQLKVTGWNRRS